MRITTFSLPLIFAPLVATAQIGNPTFMAPDTQFDRSGMPAAKQPNSSDKLFAMLAAEGGLAEVNFAQLANSRAQSDSVKDFSQQMLKDHADANSTLAALARDRGIVVPDALNSEQAAVRTQLESQRGTAFDLTYMRAQVVEHQKTVQLLLWELGNGQDAEVQQFAAQTLPVIMRHLDLAKQLSAELAYAIDR
jgi:putative membrane protein